MSHTYVYAIIPTSHEMVFEVAGLDPSDDVVIAVSGDGLAAVVSASPREDYRGLGRSAVVPYLLAHQRVVERVLLDFPVLPVRFGTVLNGVEAVRRLLCQGHDVFASVLAELRQRSQIEVVALWDVKAVLREIGGEPAIAEQVARLAARAPEETLHERASLGRQVQERLEQRRTTLAERIRGALGQVTTDTVLHPNMDESMIVNLAFLVDEDGRRALDERLEILDRDLNGSLRFRRVGPLPPYSFCTVDATPADFVQVDAARRALGLGEAATCDEIRHAYRRLAPQMHPDLHPECDSAESSSAALTKAYHLLGAYAASSVHSPAQGGERACRFDHATIESTLLISVRRGELVA